MTITRTAATPIPPASVGREEPFEKPDDHEKEDPRTTATSGRDRSLFQVDLPRRVRVPE
jgi:hypothetical protein